MIDFHIELCTSQPSIHRSSKFHLCFLPVCLVCRIHQDFCLPRYFVEHVKQELRYLRLETLFISPWGNSHYSSVVLCIYLHNTRNSMDFFSEDWINETPSEPWAQTSDTLVFFLSFVFLFFFYCQANFLPCSVSLAGGYLLLTSFEFALNSIAPA